MIIYIVRDEESNTSWSGNPFDVTVYQKQMKKHKKNRYLGCYSEAHWKDSWYLSVLVKKLGNFKEAKKIIKQSRERADLFYNYGLRIRL